MCLVPGLKEEEVQGVLDDTLRAGGLEPFFDLVLFGSFLARLARGRIRFNI